MLKRLGLFSVAAILSGCALILTVPVQGQTQDTHEEFVGTAVANHSDGTGTISIVSPKGGASCKGDFVMVNAREGQGVLICSDKRTGPFQFASAGTKGTGTGTLGNEKFIFTFGK